MFDNKHRDLRSILAFIPNLLRLEIFGNKTCDICCSMGLPPVLIGDVVTEPVLGDDAWSEEPCKCGKEPRSVPLPSYRYRANKVVR